MDLNLRIDPSFDGPERVDFHLKAMSPAVEEAIRILSKDNLEKDNPEEEGLIWCVFGTSLVPIQVENIYAVYTLREKTYVMTAQGRYEFRGRLYQIRQLLPDTFLDASRTATINARKIQFLDLSFTGTINVVMKNHERIQVSRRFVSDFKKRLGL